MSRYFNILLSMLLVYPKVIQSFKTLGSFLFFSYATDKQTDRQTHRQMRMNASRDCHQLLFSNIRWRLSLVATGWSSPTKLFYVEP